MSLLTTKHYPPYIPCPECGFLIDLCEDITEQYLLGEKLSCIRCNSDFILWELLTKTISNNHMHTDALCAIYTHSTTFTFVLQPETIHKIAFSDYGVPNDAKILAVNYTPISGENGLFPLQVHGNQPRLSHISIPNEITLFPRPIKNKLPALNTTVQVCVHWISPPKNISWENITIAFENYIDKDFNAAIVPANVAVESSVTPLLHCILSKESSNDKVEDFLNSHATYGHQVNILLPFISSMLNLPKIPNNVRGLLNTLRKHRNSIAHKGHIYPPLDQKNTGELLAAAVITIQYCSLLKKLIESKDLEKS